MPDKTARLVVLDRDGVINQESAEYIKTPEEWQPIDGSLQAIARLCAAGFDVVLATNQSGVSRGLFSPLMLDAIHRRMTAAIEAHGGVLAGIFVCPHGPDDGCECRKPKPGLMYQIEKAVGRQLAQQPVIGDSMRDIEAGRAVGARLILVRTGNGLETEKALSASDDVEVYDDLAAAADALIGPQD
jgi:D-glycero-D-manno-heptose 1,7-bisphosphate phosphatase